MKIGIGFIVFFIDSPIKLLHMSKLIISKPYNECQQNRAVTQEAAVVPVAKPQMKESIGHFNSAACISWQLSMLD